MADFPLYAPATYQPPSAEAKRDALAVETYLLTNVKPKWTQSLMSIGCGYDEPQKLCVFVTVPEAHVVECRSHIDTLRARLNWSTPVVVNAMVDDVQYYHKVIKSRWIT
jgi:hypothetical protein